ncbi:hypothetical protein Emag_007208 [Eimeria magna]
MVYDRAMRQIFPHHDLRRFVEIPPRLCPRNMDMEYSYAVAPYRVESNAQVTEDHASRWRAFGPGGLDYPSLRAADNFPAQSEYRGPHLRLWVARRPVGIWTLMDHGMRDSPAAVREEIRARGSQDDEPVPPSPVISSASTPSTSVGGSPPGNTTPRQAPGAQEPPRRRRRSEFVSALFPATPEPVDEMRSPPAPAGDDSAGAGADSSADASHSTSHYGRSLHVLVSLHCICLRPPSREDLRPSRFPVVPGIEARF